MPRFSVIIPAFNRKESTTAAIESVLSQSCKDFELILVDDGSGDGTAELELNYRGKLKYIYQENSGVSSARNTGIRNSSSDYIALLDSDDLWHRDKLQRHADFIKENPEIKIHQTEDIWIRNGVRVNPGKKHVKTGGFIFLKSLELCMISPSSVVFLREIIDRYGFFDEKLPACEDYDLWLRVTPFEYTGLINEKLITRFAGHPDQLSAMFWGMDRFRVYSIIKILAGGILENNNYTEAAKQSALKKSGILRDGAAKRGNASDEKVYSEIISLLQEEKYSQIDCSSLLKK